MAASKLLYQRGGPTTRHRAGRYLSCSWDSHFVFFGCPMAARPQLPTASAAAVRLFLLSCSLSGAGGRKPQLLCVFISPHLAALTEQGYLDSKRLW